jgi:hypothetical protein
MAPKGIVIQISGDGASAAKALELVDLHLRETAERAKESASGIGEAMEKIKSRLEAVAEYMLLYEAIDVLKELVTQTLEFGEAIEKAHEKTGLAVETLSTLHYAAAITGTEFDSLTKAVAKMGASIGNAADGNDKKASAFLKGLGLDAKELASRNDGAEIAFKRVAQAIAATENPVRRLELANGLLKKGGQDMIPMLLEVGNNWDLWKQKAQAAGVYLDGESAEALAATNKRLKDLQQHIQGAGLAFTEGLTPGLTEMLGVMSGGKDNMELMKTWGSFMIRSLALATAGFYGLASGAENAFGIIEALAADAQTGFGVLEALVPGGADVARHDLAAKGLVDAARTDLAAAKELDKQSKKFRDIAVNGPAAGPTKPFVPGGKTGGKGFAGGDDLTGKGKGTNGIAQAATALAEANATAEAAAQKSADTLLLAQMDADHKLFLTSDSNYYREKLLLQKDALDAEEAALRQRIVQLQALQTKQHSDKKVTRDKHGNSAEEEKTATDIVKLNQQINALEEKRSALDINATLADQERADALHLANLKVAAQLEEHTNSGIEARLALMKQLQQDAMDKTKSQGGDTKTLAALQQQEQALLQITDLERNLASLKAAARIEENNNSGIQARLALMEREQDIAMKKATAEGGDVKTLEALQQQEQELLRINEIEREINQTKAEGALSVGAQKDREEKDPTQRKAATKEINALNKETAATLKDLTAQYDALAATLGGEFVEKAKAMHAELDKLNRPDQKQDQQPYKKLGDGVTSMAEQMARATGTGRDGFHNMVTSMERDLVELAVKFAATKWLAPFMSSLGAGLGGGGGGAESLGQVNNDLTSYGFADGGDYSADTPRIVGEEGPELDFPKGPGTIMPDPELFFPKNAAPSMPSGALSELTKVASSGPPNVTMNVTNASSQPVTARQTGTSFDSDMKAFVIHTVLEDHAMGGPISVASQGGG